MSVKTVTCEMPLNNNTVEKLSPAKLLQMTNGDTKLQINSTDSGKQIKCTPNIDIKRQSPRIMSNADQNIR